MNQAFAQASGLFSFLDLLALPGFVGPDFVSHQQKYLLENIEVTSLIAVITSRLSVYRI